jgi:hypothetical protein
MKRRTFLASILAPFLVPLLPKDWHARKNLCKVKPVPPNPNANDGPRGVIGRTGPQGFSSNATLNNNEQAPT